MPSIESEEIIFHSGRFDVVKQVIDMGQSRHDRNLVVLGSGVALVLLDSEMNLYMIREWRSAVDDYVIQLPGGYCESDDEEKLEKAAREEALEEVGISGIQNLRKIRTYYPNIGIRNKIHIFYADKIDKIGKSSFEETEDIQILKVPLIQAHERFVLGDEETTSATIIGITLAMHLLHKLL